MPFNWTHLTCLDESGAETLWPLLGSATKIAQRVCMMMSGLTPPSSGCTEMERRSDCRHTKSRSAGRSGGRWW